VLADAIRCFALLPRTRRNSQTVSSKTEETAMHREAHARGFTLIELMLTLAVAAILAMIGAPAMAGLLARVSERNAESAVANVLRQARTAAVMHNTRTVVCPSRDGRHCRSGDDWQHGWIVGADADHDGQPDPGSRVLAVAEAMPPGTRVITSSGRGHVTFQPSGSAGGSNVRFTICHARRRDGKSVVVSNSGRVRVATPEPDRLKACLAGLR
jgi:type IV fimbrial biogenesis protein FimT